MDSPDEKIYRRVKMLVIDECPMTRLGLKTLVESTDIAALTASANFIDARATIAAPETFDLIILDISPRFSEAIEFIRQLRRPSAGTPMLVYSVLDERVYAERLLRIGVNGYVMKRESSDDLVTALRRVLAGGFYVSEDIGSRIIQREANTRREAPRSIDALSNRELEVFHLFGHGNSCRQISELLSLSVKTVNTHREHIKKKLGVRTAHHFLQLAIYHQLSSGWMPV